MNRHVEAEDLNRQIDAMLAHRDVAAAPGWETLIAIASDLRKLPSPEFKSQLKSELFEEIGHAEPTQAGLEQVAAATAFAQVLPTLGGSDYRFLPADQRSFLVSFVSHTALIVLIASGIFVSTKPSAEKANTISELTYAPTGNNGGGGSGDRSRIPATKGTAPQMSEQQLTSPVIVVHKSNPLLPAPPTVVGPPDLKLPQSNAIGDLVSSNISIPSNGTGAGGGAGSGSGTGLGGGIGAGIGPGFDRGSGGGVFRPGAGVIAPRAVYDPEPEYSEEARKVKAQGTVMLSLIVDDQGRPRNIRVARSLGMGLDEKAIEAVKDWKFVPGTKDGIPVAVQVNVEVSFRLY